MKNKNDFIFNVVTLIIYCCVILSGLYHHELWGDEIHSWNIVKGSHSLGELFSNIRYEGHPPFWYIYLFCLTQFSHALMLLKAAQFIFVVLTACVFLFYGPFGKIQKVLLLSGYYFIFEYAVLARNYMPAVFFAFCIAAIDRREFKYKTTCYYLLLLLLSNVHLLGLLLAASIHAGYCYERRKGNKQPALHLLIGILVLLPSIYFILPPSDSQLNFQFWEAHWSPAKLYSFGGVILRALYPRIDLGNPHWWNSNIFLDLHTTFMWVSALSIFALLLFAIVYALRKSKTALVIVIVNLGLTFLLSTVFPLNTYRYAGFVFIGFVIASWFSCYDKAQPVNNYVLVILLFLQFRSGFFATVKDFRNKFSSASEVVEMQKQIPANAFVATDYWCLNNLSAYLDTSFYCIELKRSVSFLVWNNEMTSAIRYDYGKGLADLLAAHHQVPFYFFSSRSKDKLLLAGADETFIIELVKESGPAIERSGEVYLYKVLPI